MTHTTWLGAYLDRESDAGYHPQLNSYVVEYGATTLLRRTCRAASEGQRNGTPGTVRSRPSTQEGEFHSTAMVVSDARRGRFDPISRRSNWLSHRL